MSTRCTSKPELESSLFRSRFLSLEPKDQMGTVQYLDHGFPSPLVHWHCHDEYELHLITDTSGKVFVGDYVGQFEPGQLVLIGSHLPHNWVSTDVPASGVALRDMVLLFSDEPLRRSAEWMVELRDTLPMLDRARYGIEFLGVSESIRPQLERIKVLRGGERLAVFLGMMCQLARCSDYRLLSSVPPKIAPASKADMGKMGPIIDFITQNCSEALCLNALSERVGMSRTQFSRQFRMATGSNFTHFVNRVRIAKACQLLMETDRYIGNVCYDVGFNNLANFNRRFLEIKGMTPRAFRRQVEARLQGRSDQWAGPGVG